MKKYLLTVFGEFNNKEIIARLGKGMAPIVDSPHLKFQHTKGAMVFHFGSEVNTEEIYDYVTGIFYGLSDAFILTEMTDKTSVYMPENIKAHLLDLENDTEEVDIRIDVPKMSKSYDDMSEMAEGFVEFLLDEFREEVIAPSLNEILDKISEKGIKSLSTFEKEILDNYSKN
jgi:hypothetical protein